MPELPVKEARMSELHLPEISRDDIKRSLSEIRMPEVDLSKVDLPDIGKAVAGVAAAANIGRRSRSRWPFAVGGLILAGMATAAILSNETIRAKIAAGIEALRDRVSTMRSTDDSLDFDQDEVVAFDAAPTAPIGDTSPFDDEPETAPTADYPSGLGSNGHEDGIPAFEESSTSRS
jgi:hypothetical protein